jgi:hypothetical protein
MSTILELLNAGVAEAAGLALLQAGGEVRGDSYQQVWAPIIGLLQGGLTAGGSLGMLLGAAIKGSAGPDTARQELGVKIIKRAMVGFALGVLSYPLSELFFGAAG